MRTKNLIIGLVFLSLWISLSIRGQMANSAGAMNLIQTNSTYNLQGVPVVPMAPQGSSKNNTLSPPGSFLQECIYSINLPTLQPGMAAPCQIDGFGRLLISALPALPPVQLAPLNRALPTISLPAPSYASYSSSAVIVIASSTTDFACLPGNSSNITLLYEARLTGIQTTAGVNAIFLVKRSTANSGSSNAMTATKDDINYPAAQSIPVNYTVNPTTGTLAGNLDVAEIGFMASSTTSPNDIYIANLRSKPIVLRSSSDEVCFNLNGATVAGGSMVPTFKWYEVGNLSTFTP